MPAVSLSLLAKAFKIDSCSSMERGVRIIDALGICSGLIVHTFAAVLGLTAIIAKSVFLFEMVKYAGAVYLLYMGISALFSKKHNAMAGTINSSILPLKPFLILRNTGKGPVFYKVFCPTCLIQKLLSSFLLLFRSLLLPAKIRSCRYSYSVSHLFF
ncbi:LysE family transporter [Aneurinibacillus sp. Ricciae_BoGa-3]|nr:LysE family transporter [Aneurinibacillus sp. Ricciae_BoGa-3]WCK56434.1 LysE family transporter [Aneurinibacillus sp. Ricciae_BoGa-3]